MASASTSHIVAIYWDFITCPVEDNKIERFIGEMKNRHKNDKKYGFTCFNVDPKNYDNFKKCYESQIDVCEDSYAKIENDIKEYIEKSLKYKKKLVLITGKTEFVPQLKSYAQMACLEICLYYGKDYALTQIHENILEKHSYLEIIDQITNSNQISSHNNSNILLKSKFYIK
jgi:hypothetical protein